MKPITSILLVLSLVCYVFLPFYEISFQGGLTGFSFTAGTISQNFSLGNALFVLLPFITCFVALGANSLQNRWWGLLVTLCVLVGLWFMNSAVNFHDVALRHAPDVTPSEDLGEGFAVIGLGVGYKASLVLQVAALCSALLSMLPFRFNERIERAVDDTIDHGWEDVRALGSRVSEEVKEWRHDRRKSVQADEHTPQQGEVTPPPLPAAADDPTATGGEADERDHARFMPPADR